MEFLEVSVRLFVKVISFIVLLFLSSHSYANETNSTKIELDLSREALYYPEKKPVFKKYFNLLKVDSSKSDFSILNAWWFSNFAHLAYYKKEKIQKELKRVNLKLDSFYDIQKTQAFIAKGDDFIVLSFRGTQTQEDFMTDIKCVFKEIDKNVNVHQGFLEAFEVAWKLIEKKIIYYQKRGYKIYYTGHSLGAALASLAAYKIKPFALYTYGSPMVGDINFSNSLKNIPIYRIVNCCDMVTTLPSSFINYEHIGELYFFSYDGELIIKPSTELIAIKATIGIFKHAQKFPIFDSSNVPLKSLIDHSIVNYSINIWNALIEKNFNSTLVRSYYRKIGKNYPF